MWCSPSAFCIRVVMRQCAFTIICACNVSLQFTRQFFTNLAKRDTCHPFWPLVHDRVLWLPDPKLTVSYTCLVDHLYQCALKSNYSPSYIYMVVSWRLKIQKRSNDSELTKQGRTKARFRWLTCKNCSYS